jgi:hypothetical protein
VIVNVTAEPGKTPPGVGPIKAGVVDAPVPLRLTTVDVPVDELLVTVNVPAAAPAVVGSNCTVSVAV